jgi:hypothetical protein
MKNPLSDRLSTTERVLGSIHDPGQTELPRDTDRVESHRGHGFDGYDENTFDYTYTNRVPMPRTIDYGDGPKEARTGARPVGDGRPAGFNAASPRVKPRGGRRRAADGYAGFGQRGKMDQPFPPTVRPPRKRKQHRD